MKNISILFLVASTLFINTSCKKQASDPVSPPPPPPNTTVFTYSDSIFYQQNQPGDYIITPTTNASGKFLSFPDGLVLDGNTGAVNVSKSETGLKYMVAFIPDDKTDTIKKFITLSGINYMDGFYILTSKDSVAYPVYNAVPGAAIPAVNNGSLFDIGSNCNSHGCTVNTNNASINLAQTVRNGVFGSTPSNNDRQEFDMDYQINDKSNNAGNKLKVKLYYFKTMNDVTSEAYDIINSRQGTIIGSDNVIPATAFSTQAAKPRPPCIFIVGR